MPTDTQTFTSSGTWTRPADATGAASITIKGGGGGGGPGGRALGGFAGGGGGGGEGGGSGNSSSSAASISVTIGAGGTAHGGNALSGGSSSAGGGSGSGGNPGSNGSHGSGGAGGSGGNGPDGSAGTTRAGGDGGYGGAGGGSGRGAGGSGGTGRARNDSGGPIRGSNGTGGSVTISVETAVPVPDANAPSISIGSVSSVNENSTLGLSAIVSGGAYDSLSYAWSVVSGGGSISGSGSSVTYSPPNVSSNQSVTVKVTVTATGTGTNAASGTSDTSSDTEGFTVNVVTGPITTPTLRLPDPSDIIGTVGGAVDNNPLPAASGGTSSYSYSVAGRPDFMGFDSSTRQLTGTESRTGTWILTYSVTSGSRTASQTFNYTINPVGPPPTLTVPSPSNIIRTRGGSVYRSALPTASGGTPPYTYLVTGLPSWLRFNASTRIFSGTESETGSWTLTYLVRDSGNPQQFVSQSFTYRVNATSQPPPLPTPPVRPSGTLPVLPRIIPGFSGVGPHTITATLPAATSGSTPITYSVAENSDDGIIVSFNASRRRVTVRILDAPALVVVFYTASNSAGSIRRSVRFRSTATAPQFVRHFYRKVAGNWRPVKLHRKTNGSWSEVKLWRKDAGTWTQISGPA